MGVFWSWVTPIYTIVLLVTGDFSGEMTKFDASENMFPVYFRRSRNFKFNGRCLEILETTVVKTSAFVQVETLIMYNITYIE